ncbi:hypothetical protein [Flavobacterium algicola]|uniref:hypothetical protein n=1 Tax=Flavobacterium algicola TaxID=556529 RepID=UPI001EFECCC1|nr:hypothetical protein [Flavobacterium algicola]MCG9792473.1 hypothetical protein [Flavobacterium algicola]
MKNWISALLITITLTGYSQTIPSQAGIKLTKNTKDNAATKVNVQSADNAVNWVDKADFEQTSNKVYDLLGTKPNDAYPTANAVIAAINSVGINTDKFIKLGSVQKTGSTVSIAANAFQWKINGVEYLTTSAFSQVIAPATDNFYRIDLIVANTLGGYTLVVGTESETVISKPDLPANTLEVTFVPVFGAVVGDIPPAQEVGTPEQVSGVLVGAGAIDPVKGQVINDYFRIRFFNPGEDQGSLEIATADNGTEPIRFRQYNLSNDGGVYEPFSSITNEVTILDENGNTFLPKSLSVGGNITALPATTSGQVVVKSQLDLKEDTANKIYDLAGGTKPADAYPSANAVNTALNSKIGGLGTVNYFPVFTASGTLGNSPMYYTNSSIYSPSEINSVSSDFVRGTTGKSAAYGIYDSKGYISVGGIGGTNSSNEELALMPFGGKATVLTPASSDDSKRIANTEWVTANAISALNPLEINKTDKTVWNSGKVAGNTVFGKVSMVNNASGTGNTAIGNSVLVSGSELSSNTSVGHNSALLLNAGSENTFLGAYAGRLDNLGDGTSLSKSVLLGANTKGTRTAENEIVIGYDTQGDGTDSAVLGNSDVKKTRLRGVITHTEYTVSTLPTPTYSTAYATVTDAVAMTYGVAPTGGGNLKVPVFWNGTAWIMH